MYYSDQKKQIQILNRRTFFLLSIKVVLFSILGSRLFNIQITNDELLKFNSYINIKKIIKSKLNE